ncbi:unnamed protein product [Cuscuta epithymum]|uniref:Uncharacterized protein n=1 Tax=Cuscuta epithymum TaxID=186058 RepID=A0AAV0EPY4_9ASTE|nr:unnamed protein product [Cuscuta epithymum]
MGFCTVLGLYYVQPKPEPAQESKSGTKLSHTIIIKPREPATSLVEIVLNAFTIRFGISFTFCQMLEIIKKQLPINAYNIHIHEVMQSINYFISTTKGLFSSMYNFYLCKSYNSSNRLFNCNQVQLL